MRDRNCMTYWFPRLSAAMPSNVPETIIIDAGDSWHTIQPDAALPPCFSQLCGDIRAAANRLGFPVFLRTGQGSGKHDWRRTCFLDAPEKVAECVLNLVEWSHLVDMMGLPYRWWVVRKFLHLRHDFTAFHGMPVALELRAFVRDGEIQCVHRYWPNEAIESGYHDPPLPTDWRARLDALYPATPPTEALSLISRVAAAFDGDGGWSVDACQDRDGKWWVTDMAVAEQSFHWPDCQNAASPPKHPQAG